MKRKALALTLVFSFLLSMLTIIEFVGFVSANFIPEQPPPGFVIESDGTVAATNIHRNGNVYTFTGDIHNTIVILRDDIVLDGVGYTLEGNGESAGIFLQDRSNVTVKNINIKNFACGIKFTFGYTTTKPPLSSTISGNTITNNTYGIIWFSDGYVISENRIINNTYGVSFSSSSNVFRNNDFESNDYSILDKSNDASDIDTSNTIDGKSVYYWVNQHDKTVPSDAGFVALKNCWNITVQGLSLEGNGDGVLLCYTTNSIISENVIMDNLGGITLKHSSNNAISGNQITSNAGSGINLQGTSINNIISDNHVTSNEVGVSLNYGSINNVISKNKVAGNAKDGMNFDRDSINNIVNENYVVENGGNGIFLSNIQDSNITGNNVTLNGGCGIGFGYGPNGMIKGNYISKNNVGIWISNAVENTITSNTIIENEGWGIRLEGSQKDNIIHHNNFIDNNNKGIQASITEIWVYPDLFKPLSPGQTARPPQLVAGAANNWDNAKEGNYWSDYKMRYPNASEINNMGVGDTSYFINENNEDRYPLMKPLPIQGVPSKTPTSETETSPQPTNPTPENTTAPDQQDKTSAEKVLPVEYTVALIVAGVGLTAASVCILLLKRKKATLKSRRGQQLWGLN